MKKKTKRLLAVGLALVLGGFVLLNVLAYNHARSLIRYAREGERTPKVEALSGWQRVWTLFTGVNLPRPSCTSLPGDLSADCRRVVIECADGPKLGAWYARGTKTGDLVMLFHGYGVEKGELLCEARALLDMGWSVLLVDFRGSGESSEAYTTIGAHEARDVAAAFGYGRASLGAGRIVLFGRSMGGAAVLRAIAELGVLPDGVIIEGVYDTLLQTVRNRFAILKLPAFPAAELLVFWGGRQMGFDSFGLKPVEYAAKVSCPALFMHGADDQRARLTEGRRVFDALPAANVNIFIEFADTAHEAYLAKYPSDWTGAVRGFLDQ